MNIQDRKKSLTAEELRQRYNLDDLNKDRKAIQVNRDNLTKVDAELNQFVDTTTRSIQNLQDQVDGNITTWFFNGVPTLANQPASGWTTDVERERHLGDLYYDQDTGYAYRFYFNGPTQEYGWSKIVDADVTEALAVANSAKDTADSKRRLFVNQPIPPYDVGDMWTDGSDLFRCRAARVAEDEYNPLDWIKATNYTDDTLALSVQGQLDAFQTTVEENYVSNATLETNLNSITGTVTEATTAVNDLNQQFTILNESITSQTSSAITEWFNQSGIQGTLDQLQIATENNSDAVSQINSYIKRGIITDESSPFYGEAYIELGDQSNQTTLRILPERIQFLTNGVETAYISNNTLYINESTILSRQQIGHWVTEQDSSGNLNTKWVN